MFRPCIKNKQNVCHVIVYLPDLQSWSIILLKINAISLVISLVTNNFSSRSRPRWVERRVELDLLPCQSPLVLQVDLEEVLEVLLAGHTSCSLMKVLMLSTAGILPESQTEETMTSEEMSCPFCITPETIPPVLGHTISPVALSAVAVQQGGAGVPGRPVPLDSCLPVGVVERAVRLELVQLLIRLVRRYLEAALLPGPEETAREDLVVYQTGDSFLNPGRHCPGVSLGVEIMVVQASSKGAGLLVLFYHGHFEVVLYWTVQLRLMTLGFVVYKQTDDFNSLSL